MVEQITDQVIEMVLSGELEPGQPLPINELAASLGVSHIPVREALRRLERDGLIQYTRGKGAQVAPVSTDDLRDIFHIRAAIEVDVARRSYPLLDEGRLAAAEQALGDMRDAMALSRPGAVSPTHRLFHQTLLPAASVWDRRVLDQLWTATERYIQLYLGSVRVADDAVESIVAAHEALLAAAKAGASRSFTKAVRDHITWSEQSIAPGVEQREADEAARAVAG